MTLPALDVPFTLDPAAPAELGAYLRARGWWDGAGALAAAKAGEGNMNLTVRARAGAWSLIVKQSRPWVQKYPQIAAPFDRALTEGRFYAAVAEVPAVAAAMPRFVGLDPASRVLALEDLGAAADCTGLYGGDGLTDSELDALAAYLAALHGHAFAPGTLAALANREMRALNHAHIFDLPYRGVFGGFLEGVAPGLAALAAEFAADAALVARVAALGQTYLADGPALLHGDFFPGSWLRSPAGLRVIDPEFCFPGPPAFDYGVCLAHLILADAPVEVRSRWLELHAAATGGGPAEVLPWAGTEVLRRLIGVAQLPVPTDLAWRRDKLAEARELVLG